MFYQTINSCLSLFCFARRIYYFHSILFTYFHYFLILRHYLLLYLNIASFIITVLLPSQFLKKFITHYDNVTLQRLDSSVFLAADNQDQDLFFLAVSYLSFNISFHLLTNSLHSQVISVQTTKNYKDSLHKDHILVLFPLKKAKRAKTFKLRYKG